MPMSQTLHLPTNGRPLECRALQSHFGILRTLVLQQRLTRDSFITADMNMKPAIVQHATICFPKL